jgi:hypothetical protein
MVLCVVHLYLLLRNSLQFRCSERARLQSGSHVCTVCLSQEMEHIFLALDDSGDNLISEDEFDDLCVAIRLRFVKTDEPTLLETYLPGESYKIRSYAVTDLRPSLVGGSQVMGNCSQV